MKSSSVRIFHDDLIVSFDTYQSNPVIWRSVVDCSFNQMVLDMSMKVPRR